MEVPVSEFDLIAFILQQQRLCRPDVMLGAGDDGAVVRVPAGCDLVVSVDTLVAGVHFFPHALPGDIGFKALAVNLSDLAAMGATPAWFTLALTLPNIDREWLTGFCQGLFELAVLHNIQLVGGDTTRGELTISIQVHGVVPQGQYLTRGGARPGDLIFVTGWLGGAALALRLLQDSKVGTGPLQEACCRKLNRPTPRLEAGVALLNLATSAIDISDGLVADLGHVLRRSDVGAVLEIDQLPLIPGMDVVVGEDCAWELALSGGDDYELCFTVPASKAHLAMLRLNQRAIGCTRIGRIVAEPGLRTVRRDGTLFPLRNAGFQHFQ